MNKALKIIGRIVVVLFLLGLAFYFLVPNDKKREVLQGLGVDEDLPIVNEISKAGYVDCEVLTARQNFNGTQWIITGAIRNTHSSETLTSVEIKFVFSDGNEIRTVEGDLRPGRKLPVAFRKKIAGHSAADFLGTEVYSAK